MYWTLELASKLEDAPWPATKDELIDYAGDKNAIQFSAYLLDYKNKNWGGSSRIVRRL